jgi:alkanesulfonate monooxygenase SsuD/methylene tetrahydromethanopterin reductase-like flavin-dependent oxidoreductase (luciferase family)
VYLLALGHPATVARQLATIDLVAPGRFTFGIGVGSDDPRELELCGIDPRTRGARTTEALECVLQLMTGAELTFRRRFYSMTAAAIRPAPANPIPVLVSGRSNAGARPRSTLRRRLACIVGLAAAIRRGDLGDCAERLAGRAGQRT